MWFYYWVKSFLKGIKNLWRFFWVVWEYREWDYTYSLRIFVKCLELQVDGHRKHDMHEDAAGLIIKGETALSSFRRAANDDYILEKDLSLHDKDMEVIGEFMRGYCSWWY
jgi:hypothetical protein